MGSYYIEISQDAVLRVLGHELNLPATVDMGPAPGGGRYEQHLFELLEQMQEEEDNGSTFQEELDTAAMDGVRDYIRAAGSDMRAWLTKHIEDSKIENAAREEEKHN